MLNMNLADDIVKLREALEKITSVSFGYLHGSSLTSSSPRDVDVALYLSDDAFKQLTSQGTIQFEAAVPLELLLSETIGKRVDVQILNRAPLSFRFRVVSDGLLLVDKDIVRRTEFEGLTRCEYFDFRPRRQEYLAEIMAIAGQDKS